MLAVMRTSCWILLLAVSVAFLHHVSGKGTPSPRGTTSKTEDVWPVCDSCRTKPNQTDCTSCLTEAAKTPNCYVCEIADPIAATKCNDCTKEMDKKCGICPGDDSDLNTCRQLIQTARIQCDVCDRLSTTTFANVEICRSHCSNAPTTTLNRCDAKCANSKKNDEEQIKCSKCRCKSCSKPDSQDCERCITYMPGHTKCEVCKSLTAEAFVNIAVCYQCDKEICGKCVDNCRNKVECDNCKTILTKAADKKCEICKALSTETLAIVNTECKVCISTTASPTTPPKIQTTVKQPPSKNDCKIMCDAYKDSVCEQCIKNMKDSGEKCDLCNTYKMDLKNDPCKGCPSSSSTSKTTTTTTTMPTTTTKTTTTTRPTTTTPRPPTTTKAKTTTPKVVPTNPPPTPSPARTSSTRSTTATLATPHPPPNLPLTVPVRIIDEPEPSTEPPIKAVATNPSVDGNGQKEDEGSNLTGLFVGLGVGAVLLLVLVGAGVATGLVVRKKLKNKKKNKGSVKTKEDLERALVEAEAHGVAGDVGMGLAADLPPVPMPVRRPIHAKRQGAMKTTGPVRQMEAGKIIKTGFAFEGPLHFDATGNHGPLVHATEGQKSHSLRDVFFSDQMNRVFDMGSEIEHVVKSEEHDVSKKKSTVDEQKKDSKKDSKKNTTPPAPPAPDPNQPPPPPSQPPPPPSQPPVTK